MNKETFLHTLKINLFSLSVKKEEIYEIIKDYDQLYDDMLASGKSDKEVWYSLGDPERLAEVLLDTLRIKKENGAKQKIIAITPFISLIIFFQLGFLKGLWHPGWLVFLLIPISAILFGTKLKEGIVSLMPFVAVIIYMVLGFGFQLWHPGWLVFLIIPVVSILLYTKLKDVFIAISPFVALTAFFILGEYGYYNPGWLVFLIIPIIGVLYKEKLYQIIIYELSFAAAIIFYLYMFYYQDNAMIGLVGFILPLCLGILWNDIQFNFQINGRNRLKSMLNVLFILLTIVIFVVLGLTLNAWAWAWQVFLAIPMFSIILWSKRPSLTALMPFISVILFFSLGYFMQLFYISWLAFLLIPMVAILENKAT